MKRNNIKGSLILCLAALIWGLAFVAQNKATAVPPFMLNCLRSFISIPFLFILYKILNRKKAAPLIPKNKKERKTVLLGSLICGLLLTVAVNFQQFGIALYPKDAPVEAHAGFITALYVVIVPIITAIVYKRFSWVIFAASCVALVGFYFLCLKGGIGTVYLGDLMVLLCAVGFSLQIIFVDKYVESVGGIRLSLFQFIIVTLLSGVLSLIFERADISFAAIKDAALPILYLGIMSSSIAYTLQIIGQRYAEPAVASISMSLESVFAAIGGFLLSGGTLEGREIAGCLLVFFATILAQSTEIFKKKED